MTRIRVYVADSPRNKVIAEVYSGYIAGNLTTITGETLFRGESIYTYILFWG